MDGSEPSLSHERLQLVVVALPTEEDYVRKISSEKEPHLTLLYLGENQFNDDELSHIIGYIEHAASQFSCFGLNVERRGELGDDQADVLFFDKKWSKDIEKFRSQLLRDDLISKAYLSTEQFPEWTPHLTMGYPDSPAKKDTREYPKFSWVSFDRIALWMGDSSGPTFKLTSPNYGEALAMSQSATGRSVTNDILQHHGIKGMKWGVTRSQPSSSSNDRPTKPPSIDALDAAITNSRGRSDGVHVLSNQELQRAITRMNLETQYRNLTTTPHKSELDKGLLATQKILKIGATVENVRKFLETPTGQAVKSGLKLAITGAKVAAAVHTGGASAAAGVVVTAGSSLAVRRRNQ